MLLEVVVGMAILALCLAAAYAALSGAVDGMDRGQRVLSAWAVAQSTLARIGQDIPLREGDVAGPPGETYRWSASIAATNERADRDGVLAYLVDVRVQWQERGRLRQVRLRSLTLGPATVP